MRHLAAACLWLSPFNFELSTLATLAAALKINYHDLLDAQPAVRFRELLYLKPFFLAD